jgi:hypothetical protein
LDDNSIRDRDAQNTKKKPKLKTNPKLDAKTQHIKKRILFKKISLFSKLDSLLSINVKFLITFSKKVHHSSFIQMFDKLNENFQIYPNYVIISNLQSPNVQ